MIKKLHRRSIRIPGYDYTKPGMYFLTICTKNRECLFGEVVDSVVALNHIGEIVQQTWEELAGHFPNTELIEFIVMPNHVHGIIRIVYGTHDVGAGFPRPKFECTEIEDISPRGAGTAPLQKRSLGQMVAFFKYTSTKRINEYRRTSALPVWQRNYYEHVIRSDKTLNKIRGYIANNPMNWNFDEENPTRPLTGLSPFLIIAFFAVFIANRLF